jgi:hypothetical protein
MKHSPFMLVVLSPTALPALSSLKSFTCAFHPSLLILGLTPLSHAAINHLSPHLRRNAQLRLTATGAATWTLTARRQQQQQKARALPNPRRNVCAKSRRKASSRRRAILVKREEERWMSRDEGVDVFRGNPIAFSQERLSVSLAFRSPQWWKLSVAHWL